MDDQKPIVYRIKPWALGKLNELIAKYNRRAARMNHKPIVFNITMLKGNRLMPERDLEGNVTHPAGPFSWLEVTFEGDPLRVNGWEFLGTVQHEETGNILRCVPGKDIPDTYRDQKPYCEHCRTARSRKDTFVLAKETGERMMVGRNCLRDFLGHDPDMQLRLLDALYQLRGEPGSGWAQATTVYELLDMSAAVALSVGFVRGSPFEAWDYIFKSPDLCKMIREGKAKDIRTSEESKGLADKALAWVNAQTQPSGFVQNLQAIAKLQVITHREVNLCGWIVGAYLKQVETDKMRAVQVSERQRRNEALKDSTHMGTVGSRVEMELKLILEKKISFQDGEQLTLFKFVTPEGNVVTWLTAAGLPGRWVKNEYMGEVFQALPFDTEFAKVKATIKQHREYEGIKETAVNRLAVATPRKESKKKTGAKVENELK